MAELPVTHINPHHTLGLGFFALGATLHHILTRIKSEPSQYPKIQLTYSPSEPLLNTAIINLPANGMRLSFDGPDQRLRLIEVLDFTKSRLQYKETIIYKQEEFPALSGPSFKHIYNRLGATTPGELLGEDGKKGKYCISWPGISFWFPLEIPEGFSQTDWAKCTSVLSSEACGAAMSMSIFDGESWPVARKSLYSPDMSPFPRAPVPNGTRKEGIPAEVDRAKVYDKGRIELVRRDAPSFWIILSETTQQDLLTELGPPDSTVKKSSRNTTAHHHRRTSSTNTRSSAIPDSESSSANSETDDTSAWSDEEEDDETAINDDKEDLGTWWNYYAHGLDILITAPTKLSKRSPSSYETAASSSEDDDSYVTPRNHLTATKVVLHGNVPGSYQFNRHRRLRWTLESYPSGAHTDPLTSEMKFRDIQGRLIEVFKDYYENDAEKSAQQQPMAINRDWGEGSSLGGSVEFLGGWEEGKKKGGAQDGTDVSGDGNVNIGEVLVYGFPGMGFEVLRNGVVGLLQVW